MNQITITQIKSPHSMSGCQRIRQFRIVGPASSEVLQYAKKQLAKNHRFRGVQCELVEILASALSGFNRWYVEAVYEPLPVWKDSKHERPIDGRQVVAIKLTGHGNQLGNNVFHFHRENPDRLMSKWAYLQDLIALSMHLDQDNE